MDWLRDGCVDSVECVTGLELCEGSLEGGDSCGELLDGSLVEEVRDRGMGVAAALSDFSESASLRSVGFTAQLQVSEESSSGPHTSSLGQFFFLIGLLCSPANWKHLWEL